MSSHRELLIGKVRVFLTMLQQQQQQQSYYKYRYGCCSTQPPRCQHAMTSTTLVGVVIVALLGMILLLHVQQPDSTTPSTDSTFRSSSSKITVMAFVVTSPPHCFRSMGPQRHHSKVVPVGQEHHTSTTAIATATATPMISIAPNGPRRTISTGSSGRHHHRRLPPLMAWRLIGKYFQIEEMEDRDACTTEVILNPNSTVTTLETNGPRHAAATGMWRLDKLTGDFIMTLHRTYEAGRESKISTDVGTFTFTTVRKFIGRLYNIGIKQGISGNIYDASSSSDTNSVGQSVLTVMDIDDTTPIAELRKVGFFEMIDTTLSEDGEAITIPGRSRST